MSHRSHGCRGPVRALRLGHLRLHQDLSPELTQGSTQYVLKPSISGPVSGLSPIPKAGSSPLVLSRFTICHKTEVVKNTLNPVWQPFSIPVRALCNGDYDRSASV